MKQLILLVTIVVTICSCTKEKLDIIQTEESKPITAAKTTSFNFTSIQKYDFTGQRIMNPCTKCMMTATDWKLTVSLTGVYKGAESTVTVHTTGTAKYVDSLGNSYIGTLNSTWKQTQFINNIWEIKIFTNERINSKGIGTNLTFTQKYTASIYPDGTILYKADPITELKCQ